MNSKRLLVVIAAGAGMLSAFLPWVTVGRLSFSGTDGSDGWIVLGVFVVPLIVALVGDRGLPLSGAQKTCAIVFGVIGVVLGGWKISDVNSIPHASLGRFEIKASPGIGLFLMLAAGVAVIVGAALSTTSAPQRPMSPGEGP